ncbi:MAG: DUF2275 domain-containing protein [Deltaproteobacteria bacterium]|nr:DUF2275 domain-containing protein [Deltaproteobacteria bacterium]
MEGAVPEAEGREIERHLETCGHCRAALQDLKKTGAILAGLEEKEPPPWFTQKVMAQVRRDAGEKKGLLQKIFFPLRIKIPLEVAASLLVAVLAWQVYKASPPEMKALPETPTSPQLLQRESTEKDVEKEITARPSKPAREKKETGDAVGGKMETQAVPAGSGTGELKRQEEAVPAARFAETPATEERKTAAADRAAPAHPAPTLLKKSEPAEARPAPAPVFQAAPRRMEREPQEKDESQKLEVFRDKARVMSQAAPEMPSQVLTVRVREVDRALKTVRELLRQVGAENIREEGLDGKMVVSGVVKPGDLDRLTGQLKTFGEVSRKESPASGIGQSIWVRIEIVPMVP